MSEPADAGIVSEREPRGTCGAYSVTAHAFCRLPAGHPGRPHLYPGETACFYCAHFGLPADVVFEPCDKHRAFYKRMVEPQEPAS